MVYMYKGTVCSDLNTIKNFIDKILSNLEIYIRDKDTMFDIRLILNELIVNGALHGNQCMLSKCVSLTIEMVDNKLRIEVEDEGKGIDFDLCSYDPKDLKTWGRGLVLVNGLSDEFHVEKNRVISVKKII
ncbi:ATP-binding protein [Tissierella sp. Yu-01]|uniref:ATP-binding protein n=1 Tax=Tissierella sp. Yu-01 TaxID=3035694 RepID=UPI00240E0FF2|nr:ATP-binding protein [Tissierella sp. Yu-01]WFA10282.1 ATP-binding protein [Tissierella sp. Yu-01]